MHWLEERLRALRKMSEDNLALRDERDRFAKNGGGRTEELIRLQDELSGLRRRQREESSELTDLLASREGVSGAFLAQDGLLMAASGLLVADFEPYAAISQRFTETAGEAMQRLSLGAMNQLVLVGEENKLALMFVGSMVVGIVCPRSVVLGSILADPAGNTRRL